MKTKVELNGVKAGMKEEMAAQAKARGWSAEAMKFAMREHFGERIGNAAIEKEAGELGYKVVESTPELVRGTESMECGRRIVRWVLDSGM